MQGSCEWSAFHYFVVMSLWCSAPCVFLLIFVEFGLSFFLLSDGNGYLGWPTKVFMNPFTPPFVASHV